MDVSQRGLETSQSRDSEFVDLRNWQKRIREEDGDSSDLSEHVDSDDENGE